MPNRREDGGIYIEVTGRTVTASDLSGLTPAERLELMNTPFNRLDALFMHKSNHDLRNAIQAHILEDGAKEEKLETSFDIINQKLDKINQQFYIEVYNGKKEKKHIGTILLEHHSDMQGLRWRKRFVRHIKENKGLMKLIFWVSGTILTVLGVIFRDTLSKIINNLFGS